MGILILAACKGSADFAGCVVAVIVFIGGIVAARPPDASANTPRAIRSGK